MIPPVIPRPRSLFPGLLLLCGVLTVGTASACKCRPPDDPATSLESARAVFSGRVLSTQRDPSGMIRVWVRVNRAWKGSLQSVVPVLTTTSSAACGYTFQQGETYMIYSYGMEAGDLNANICSRTRRISEAVEDLDVLGPGYAPSQALRGKPQPAHVAALQRKLRGTWISRDAQYPRMEIEPTGTSTGVIVFRTTSGKNASQEYEIVGANRLRWKNFVGGTTVTVRTILNEKALTLSEMPSMQRRRAIRFTRSS